MILGNLDTQLPAAAGDWTTWPCWSPQSRLVGSNAAILRDQGDSSAAQAPELWGSRGQWLHLVSQSDSPLCCNTSVRGLVVSSIRAKELLHMTCNLSKVIWTVVVIVVVAVAAAVLCYVLLCKGFGQWVYPEWSPWLSL